MLITVLGSRFCIALTAESCDRDLNPLETQDRLGNTQNFGYWVVYLNWPTRNEARFADMGICIC